MKYYLGIDIGNSKNQYAIADRDGNLIGISRGPGSNHQGIGIDETYKRLDESINSLLKKTGTEKSQIVFAYLGVCGADSPEEFIMLRKTFRNLFGNVQFDFDNDGIIALKNGVENETGVVITCGSGNTNFAVNTKGDISRIGGLCEYMGDMLGSVLIAKQAVHAAVRGYDGRGDLSTVLTSLICKEYNFKEIYEFIDLEIDSDSEIVKTIIKILFKAAELGDGVALEIIIGITKEIYTITDTFASKMFDKDEIFRLVLDGHIFRANYPVLMNMINLSVLEKYNAKIIIPQTPPVLGALYFAYEKDGNKLNTKIINNLKETYKEIGD
jgi:N-acetylglucosamine kinase-like BadF-type ATPase